MDERGRMYCQSSWTNPTYYGYTSDREEPDSVSYSGQAGTCVPDAVGAEVARISDPSAWMGVSGTSIAAPSLASQFVLAAKACGVRYFDHLAGRAAARNLAMERNPLGWKYSTPQQFPYSSSSPGDQQDGAGFAVFGDCRPDPDRVSGVERPADSTASALPAGEFPNRPPGETHFSSHTGPTGKKGYVVSQRTLAAGARVRATISWDTCASKGTALSGLGTVATIKNDFDLYLYDKTNARYVFGSQSVDDNNEGFDVVVPSAGDYQVMVAWDQELRKCGTNVDLVAHDVIFRAP